MVVSPSAVNGKVKGLINLLTPEVCKAGRALASLTQQQLAAEANVAPQTVADYERGARTPHPNNLKALVEVFAHKGVVVLIEHGVPVGVKKCIASAGQGN